MRARITASIVLAAALTVGVSGCTFITPQDTTRITESSNGVNGDVGEIAVRNATIISGTGAIGNLVATFVNNGSQAAKVEVQRGARGGRTDSFYVNVPANSVKRIGVEGSQIVLFEQMHSAPGSLYPVFFQYGDHTGVRLLVPVLNGTLSQYEHLLPSDVRPTPTPTATPGATPAPTPAG